MKQKSALLKNPDPDSKNEIEFLKMQLKESRKKCSEERKKNKYIADYTKVLYNKLLKTQSEIKALGSRGIVLIGLLDKSTEKLCNNMVKERNLDPLSIADVQGQKADLKKMPDTLSSLIQKSDLLERHCINKFLSNQN